MRGERKAAMATSAVSPSKARDAFPRDIRGVYGKRPEPSHNFERPHALLVFPEKRRDTGCFWLAADKCGLALQLFGKPLGGTLTKKEFAVDVVGVSQLSPIGSEKRR